MRNRLSLENALYLLAIVFALTLRLVNLGAPLSDFEASWAMQAFNLSTDSGAAISGQPIYAVLTGFLFNLFGSSETLARLLPALVGASLAALPFLYREKIGRAAAVVLAFGLAIDPGLIAISRSAGSPVLALGFGLWGLTAWYLGAPIAAGILLALALLSGPAAFAGLVMLAGALLVRGIFQPKKKEEAEPRAGFPSEAQRPALIAGAFTLLLGGTLFLRYPQGLSAMVAAIPDYFTGWAQPPATPFVFLLLAPAVYQPLAVVFGYIGLLRAWVQNQAVGKALSIWLGVSLLLALAYPARQVYDVAWMLTPLWALAAIEIARYLDWGPEERRSAWGHALLVLALLTFTWLNLASLIYQAPGTPEYQTRLGVTAVALALVAASSILVAYGWSFRSAGRGLAWGGAAFLAVVGLAAAWGVTRPGARAASELWYPGPAPGQTAIFAETLGDLSEWESGHPAGAEVLYQVEWPSLQWALRLMPGAQFASALPAEASPPLVISDEMSGDPAIAAAYRGQSFAWRVYSAWDENQFPPNLLQWWLFRQSFTFSEKVVLWGRTDVFPEDVLTTMPDGDEGLLPDLNP